MASRTAGTGNERFAGLILKGVKETGEEFGVGAYGRVFAVDYYGTVCAAKEVHSILISGVGVEEFQRTRDNFLRECQQCAELRHPNIVQFLGVYYKPGSLIPILMMEKMDESLRSSLERYPKIPMTIKLSILFDVSLGLRYLHSHKIVHRDLSSNNVLLSTLLRAKISDLGVAKVVRSDSKKSLTKIPGTADFMPPEAQLDMPIYDTSLDVFSYGGVVLHTATQLWPTPSAMKQYDPKTRKVRGFTEVERRQSYIDQMTGNAEELVSIAVQCLDDDPEVRPSMIDVSERVKRLKDRSPDVNMNPMSLLQQKDQFKSEVDQQKIIVVNDQQKREIDRQKREIDEQKKEIDQQKREINQQKKEISQQKRINDQQKWEIDQQKREIDQQKMEIDQQKRETNQQIDQQKREIDEQKKEIDQQKREINQQKKEISQQKRKNEQQKREIDQQKKQIDQQMREIDQLQKHIRSKRSTKRAATKEESPEFGHSLQSGRYKLKWTKCSKLPTAMYAAYAAVVNSTLYISGGWCPNDTMKIYNVFKYELDKNQWSILPPLQQYYGIPVNISDQLTIISGRCSTPPYKVSNQVITYSDNKWSNTYPNLSVGRANPAVVPYHQYVIVAGGKGDHNNFLDIIEVFDLTKSHWMIVNTHLPKPMYQISATICGDSFTIVGYTGAGNSGYRETFMIPIEGIISLPQQSRHSLADKDNTKWHQLADAPYWNAALVPNTSPPVIIGGNDELNNTVNDITIYDEKRNEWNKISSLPINCAFATIAVINQSVVVMGGCSDKQTTETINATALSDVKIGQLVATA